MHIFHKYKPVSVYKFAERYPDNSIFDTYTRVLYKCDVCGKLKVEQLKGEWNLEDIRK